MLVRISEACWPRAASGWPPPTAPATRWPPGRLARRLRAAHQPLIVVQDRDWQSLPAEARERVRSLQREYVDLWATQLQRRHPGLALDRARAMAHATFGLINSTPHSSLLPPEDMHELLSAMALRSLS